MKADDIQLEESSFYIPHSAFCIRLFHQSYTPSANHLPR